MNLAKRWSSTRRQRTAVAERWLLGLLILMTSVTVVMGGGVVVSLFYEAMRFFGQVNVVDFMTGTHWAPLDAAMPPETVQAHYFGALPLFAGTLLIAVLALGVAVPLGLGTALYLHAYASSRHRAIIRPVLEMLSGVPTVVYGFFAVTVMGPALRAGMGALGIDVGGESAVLAGLVMGFMILPLMAVIVDDALAHQPRSWRDGSSALGATRSETLWRVQVPGALPGLIQGGLLALSRAVGETMLVVMAAGLSAQWTLNPLEPVTTVTVQIVALLSGDQSFESPATMAAFALGLVLFVVTFLLNIVGVWVQTWAAQKYEAHHV